MRKSPNHPFKIGVYKKKAVQIIWLGHSRADVSNLEPLSHRFWSFLAWRYPPGRNLEIPNFFALGPLGGVLWPFEILAFFGYFQLLNSHNSGSTNDRRLVLVSNIMFWDELSEKKFENFFWAPKDHFLAKRGPFWVPITPKYEEIWNFEFPTSISQ